MVVNSCAMLSYLINKITNKIVWVARETDGNRQVACELGWCGAQQIK